MCSTECPSSFLFYPNNTQENDEEATTFWQRRRLWVKLQGEMQKTSLLPSQQPPTSESTRWDSVVKAEQCRRS